MSSLNTSVVFRLYCVWPTLSLPKSMKCLPRSPLSSVGDRQGSVLKSLPLSFHTLLGYSVLSQTYWDELQADGSSIYTFGPDLSLEIPRLSYCQLKWSSDSPTGTSNARGTKPAFMSPPPCPSPPSDLTGVSQSTKCCEKARTNMLSAAFLHGRDRWSY